MKSERTQASICAEFGSELMPPDSDSKVGIAISSLGKKPLNALRHPPEGSTCGWYIWGGVELPDKADFFQALHVHHLVEHCPEIVPYLALALGWRVLLAPGYEDVWYDFSLLSV